MLDLDDDSVLQLVREDVGTALASPGLVAIDEFHRAPEVLVYSPRFTNRWGHDVDGRSPFVDEVALRVGA